MYVGRIPLIGIRRLSFLTERGNMLLEPKKQANLLRAAWMMGFSKGSYVIDCGDEKAARRLRFRLYEAVKNIRRGKEHTEPDLVEAIAESELALEGSKVIIRRKPIPPALQALADSLGMPAAAPIQSVTPEIQASIDRAKELLKEETQPTRVTPYYNREN